jgi:hypothetical protein
MTPRDQRSAPTVWVVEAEPYWAPELQRRLAKADVLAWPPGVTAAIVANTERPGLIVLVDPVGCGREWLAWADEVACLAIVSSHQPAEEFALREIGIRSVFPADASRETVGAACQRLLQAVSPTV